MMMMNKCTVPAVKLCNTVVRTSQPLQTYAQSEGRKVSLMHTKVDKEKFLPTFCGHPLLWMTPKPQPAAV